jgi:hypothetical protein
MFPHGAHPQPYPPAFPCCSHDFFLRAAAACFVLSRSCSSLALDTTQFSSSQAPPCPCIPPHYPQLPLPHPSRWPSLDLHPPLLLVLDPTTVWCRKPDANPPPPVTAVHALVAVGGHQDASIWRWWIGRCNTPYIMSSFVRLLFPNSASAPFAAAHGHGDLGGNRRPHLCPCGSLSCWSAA